MTLLVMVNNDVVVVSERSAELASETLRCCRLPHNVRFVQLLLQ